MLRGTNNGDEAVTHRLLMDKQSTGWLVWGDSVEFYEVPPQSAEPIEWDVSSKDALDQLRSIILTASWWETFVKHLSQEKTIDYLASDVITIIKVRLFTDSSHLLKRTSVADRV